MLPRPTPSSTLTPSQDHPPLNLVVHPYYIDINQPHNHTRTRLPAGALIVALYCHHPLAIFSSSTHTVTPLLSPSTTTILASIAPHHSHPLEATLILAKMSSTCATRILPGAHASLPNFPRTLDSSSLPELMSCIHATQLVHTPIPQTSSLAQKGRTRKPPQGLKGLSPDIYRRNIAPMCRALLSAAPCMGAYSTPQKLCWSVFMMIPCQPALS